MSQGPLRSWCPNPEMNPGREAGPRQKLSHKPPDAGRAARLGPAQRGWSRGELEYCQCVFADPQGQPSKWGSKVLNTSGLKAQVLSGLFKASFSLYQWLAQRQGLTMVFIFKSLPFPLWPDAIMWQLSFLEFLGEKNVMAACTCLLLLLTAHLFMNSLN